MPEGSIIDTVPLGGEIHPVGDRGLGFPAAKRLLLAVGAEVPEMMNWCAGKLGPWLVWNMRSANVYCSASAK